MPELTFQHSRPLLIRPCLHIFCHWPFDFLTWCQPAPLSPRSPPRAFSHPLPSAQDALPSLLFVPSTSIYELLLCRALSRCWWKTRSLLLQESRHLWKDSPSHLHGLRPRPSLVLSTRPCASQWTVPKNRPGCELPLQLRASQPVLEGRK